MNIEFSDIGWGIFIACLGVAYVIDHHNDANRLTECDKRGGAMVKTDDSWSAEKHCVVAQKASQP